MTTLPSNLLSQLRAAHATAGFTRTISLETRTAGVYAAAVSVTAEVVSESRTSEYVDGKRHLVLRARFKIMQALVVAAKIGDRVTYGTDVFIVTGITGADVPALDCVDRATFGLQASDRMRAEGA